MTFVQKKVKMKNKNLPTKEEIIKLSKIHPARIKNIYLFGSQVYGNNREDSDFDFIVTCSSTIAKQEIKEGRINLHLHTHDVFKDDLYKHDIHDLECFFAPDWAKLQIKDSYNFVINNDKLKKSVLSESSNSWHKAKLKLRDEDYYKSAKSVWHSIRMLMFAIDMCKNGAITDFSVANLYWDAISSTTDFDWTCIKKELGFIREKFEKKLIML